MSVTTFLLFDFYPYYSLHLLYFMTSQKKVLRQWQQPSLHVVWSGQKKVGTCPTVPWNGMGIRG